ncbi:MULTISPECIES: L,D-transpeptidase family protein [Pseudovibrio]|uniref:L,D-transpeptidase family protein n=1 Tax=Stappiaceae TaxID=2821832 RepID=UPI0023669794|nr:MULTISPECIES: L,D-transpeptidase family protein [Pseudovibrio]MDD7908383.1 L,D-transpeptidase family protein [Pseudovibrio exalbescens]MDX5592509.1 L,D-transpeptidase family protein [Pseudovibrio sp. SPO723]
MNAPAGDVVTKSLETIGYAGLVAGIKEIGELFVLSQIDQTRRSRLISLLCGAALAMSAGAAVAQVNSGVPNSLGNDGFAPAAELPSGQLQFVDGTEWQDSFDRGSGKLAKLDFQKPSITLETADYLRGAIYKYQQIVVNGGWPQVPGGTKAMRMGMRHDNVIALRQRLMVSGDLAQSAGLSNTFDSYVDSAVRAFQLRHGLTPDGVVGQDTLDALNVSADARLRQLQTNLERVEELAPKLKDRYVMVNIPGASIEAVDHGQVRSRHTAVVGKIDRQTPIVNSAIHELNFNPYWTVPVSIIRKDLIPRMQENPNYLAENRIRIFDWHGNELQWQDIDWGTDEATQYRFTQEPGDGNSMGTMRINFHNTHQVYLHDTPEQSLFGSGYRFHSSGCVRVQNVRELATWLLSSTTPEWDRSRVDDAIRSGERLDVRMKSKIPLHMAYITAWAQADGVVHFRGDIYNRDGIGTGGTDTAAINVN